MQNTRAPGSTGGTNSTPPAGSVSPAGSRDRCPAGSAQNSSSPATTVTCAPSSDSAATSTGPPSRRMPTILICALPTSVPQTPQRFGGLCFDGSMSETPSAGQALADAGLTGIGRAGRTRAEQLAAALDARIRSRGLAAGEPVGTLDSLRAETGLGYATVSEAVRLLRDRGVLEIRPGRGGGLFVADGGPVVRLRHTLLSVVEEPRTVADAIELRDHIEVLIDVGAARHRTDRDVAELRDQLQRMRTAPDWDGFMCANWALHERIAAISPNEMARAVYTSTLGHLNAASSRVDENDPGAVDYRTGRYQVHVDLVEAIADGDESAVRAAVARHNTTT